MRVESPQPTHGANENALARNRPASPSTILSAFSPAHPLRRPLSSTQSTSSVLPRPASHNLGVATPDTQASRSATASLRNGSASSAPGPTFRGEFVYNQPTQSVYNKSVPAMYSQRTNQWLDDVFDGSDQKSSSIGLKEGAGVAGGGRAGASQFVTAKPTGYLAKPTGYSGRSAQMSNGFGDVTPLLPLKPFVPKPVGHLTQQRSKILGCVRGSLKRGACTRSDDGKIWPHLNAIDDHLHTNDNVFETVFNHAEFSSTDEERILKNLASVCVTLVGRVDKLENCVVKMEKCIVQLEDDLESSERKSERKISILESLVIALTKRFQPEFNHETTTDDVRGGEGGGRSGDGGVIPTPKKQQGCCYTAGGGGDVVLGGGCGGVI
jgi:hypothetical protein